MNYCQESTLWFYLSFALNLQIEHHLFPGISHDHWTPDITAKFQEVCKKHDVHYWTEPSIFKAVGLLFDALTDLKGKEPIEADTKKTN